MRIYQLDDGSVGRLGVSTRDIGKWAVVTRGVIVRKFSTLFKAQKFVKEVENHGK